MKCFVLVVTLLVTAGAAIAASSDVPKRKSGLWEITVSKQQRQGQPDHATMRRRKIRRHDEKQYGRNGKTVLLQERIPPRRHQTYHRIGVQDERQHGDDQGRFYRSIRLGYKADIKSPTSRRCTA